MYKPLIVACNLIPSVMCYICFSFAFCWCFAYIHTKWKTMRDTRALAQTMPLRMHTYVLRTRCTRAIHREQWWRRARIDDHHTGPIYMQANTHTVNTWEIKSMETFRMMPSKRLKYECYLIQFDILPWIENICKPRLTKENERRRKMYLHTV